MRKTIAVLVVLLMAVGSAQGVTVLMDENFDSAADGVDLDTLPGWVNTGGSGVLSLMTTTLPGGEVDGSTRGFKQDPTQLGSGWSSEYSYAVSDVTLGAGEFYRFEVLWNIIDDESQSNGSVITRLVHSDGHNILYYWDANGNISFEIYNSSGSRILKNRIYPAGEGDIRFRIDADANGVTASYDMGATGSWVEQGNHLATENPLFGYSGGITEVIVQISGHSDTNMAMGDTLSLVVLPEPATLAVLALGGFAVLLRRKR